MSSSPKGAVRPSGNLQSGSTLTQTLANILFRNIYYKDPTLFKTQMTVDHYVDIIAYTFGVSRRALNVVSGQRQLLLGASLNFYNFRLPLQKGLLLGNSP